MRERHIDFDGHSVRAILAGAKSQTRRVVTVPWHKRTRALPYEPYWIDSDGELKFCDEYGDYHPMSDFVSPYGAPGDRLWVRETWRPIGALSECAGPGDLEFRSDLVGEDADADYCIGDRWRSPLFMPRWASRLLLEITSVRVEWLKGITEEDAIAEGCIGHPVDGHAGFPIGLSPVDEFRSGWDQINGKKPGRSWADNPWVWVISFRRMEPQ